MKVIIEIPKDDTRRRHKPMYDKPDESGFIDFGPIKEVISVNDGVMPVHYGYITETLNKKEGDEIDALVVSSRVYKVGQEVEAKPIALIRRDDGDDKIISVDESMKLIREWSDVPAAERKLIIDFFGFNHKISQIGNADLAEECLAAGYENFKDKKAQIDKLEKILGNNPAVMKILERAPDLGLPNWYLASGGIIQTVWNANHGFDPENGIKDYDLVYYDADDLTYEAEDDYVRKGEELFKDIGAGVDIKNQARVHVWFKEKFGFDIPQYKSTEDAISSWSTTASCVGVRYDGREFRVYAPYGLDDIFAMTPRPVKRLFPKEMYEDKINRWKNMWPNLKMVQWNQDQENF